jgi:hypothetical protein
MLYLQIQNEGGEDIEVKINDIAGNQIFSKKFKNKLNNFNEKIDLSNYPEGNYILTIGQELSKINKTIIRY